jgi:hypothetical protein
LDLRYEINGLPVIKAEELETSPTMNAHLDNSVAASCRAAENRASQAAQIPLFSRTATLRQGSGAGQSGALEQMQQELLHRREEDKTVEQQRASQTGNERSLPSSSSSVFDEESEQQAIRELLGGSDKCSLRRTQSSTFMLSWVQPAVQEVHDAAYLERIAQVISDLRIGLKLCILNPRALVPEIDYGVLQAKCNHARTQTSENAAEQIMIRILITSDEDDQDENNIDSADDVDKDLISE